MSNYFTTLLRLKMVNHDCLNGTVEKHHLYPPVPPLTRYTEAVFPIMKKKLVECVLLEEEVNAKLKELTISKLCIRLNTLQVRAISFD